MIGDTVLQIEHLSKKFSITLKRSMYYGMLDIARCMVGFPVDSGKLRKGEFWALDDVSFELKRGESLGIIGVNGSGKSTLLRLITGIFPPDKGKVSFRGRVGALIAVGAGFHPHMTGRENIYLNGTILGMTRKEIDRKLDEIIDFAEIGEFIEAPVNNYSSGMRVRLGFSIAVHCEPDILLVDEILSVGDLSFRNKSMRKMAEFRERANALIFISHNLEQVRNLCSRVVTIDKGKIVYDGDTNNGIVRYEEMSRSARLIQFENTTVKVFGETLDELEIVKFGLLENQKFVKEIKLDSSVCIYCEFNNKNIQDKIIITFGILDEAKKPCIWLISNLKEQVLPISKGRYLIKVDIPEHHLMPGIYFLNFSIRNTNFETLSRFYSDYSFKVISDGETFERGIVRVDEKWTIEKLK